MAPFRGETSPAVLTASVPARAGGILAGPTARATSGVTWALTSSGNPDLLRLQWRQVMRKIVAGHTVKSHWFVSVETQTFARQTKTFPTEAEAKQFAKEMLANKSRI